MPLHSLNALVRIAVFVLFHPTELQVRPVDARMLVVRTAAGQQIVASGSAATLRGAARVTGRDGAAADFLLSVPGRIERHFRGVLEVREVGAGLQAVVLMDRELAVASALAAESPPGAPIEEMKAQAVASRSFYAAASGRHAGFDYCDTTHCQFLRQPPSPGDLALFAAEQTRAMVLTLNGAILPALFSANCGGHTDSLGAAFIGVQCPLAGPREGHGLGLCQRGAVAMASKGADFRAILHHYYPNTTIVAIP